MARARLFTWEGEGGQRNLGHLSGSASLMDRKMPG